MGSAYLWTSDIELTLDQESRNLGGPHGPLNPDRARRAALTWSRHCREKRGAYQEEGRRRAPCRRSAPPSRLHALLAEGGKGRVREIRPPNGLIFSPLSRRRTQGRGRQDRDDPKRLRDERATIDEIEHYWLELLQPPDSAARKHTLNHLPTSSSGKARNKLPFGVCSLLVHSTRVVQRIYGAIQEYGGFDEPAWLD